MSASASAGDYARVSALAGLAWAYLACLRKGDFVRASMVLSTFQEQFNAYRGALLRMYAPSARAGADEALPRSLSPRGGFDSSTRLALISTLSRVDERLRTVATTMPNSAGALGHWFDDRLLPVYPADGSEPTGQLLWGAVGEITRADVASTGQAAYAWSWATAEGIETGRGAREATNVRDPLIQDIQASVPSPPVGPQGPPTDAASSRSLDAMLASIDPDTRRVNWQHAAPYLYGGAAVLLLGVGVYYLARGRA